MTLEAGATPQPKEDIVKSIAQLDAELNQAIVEGRSLEAFEKLYADDIVMMENDQAFKGKDVNRKREQEFFGNIEKLNSAKLLSSGVGDDVTFAEMSFDATLKNGQRMRMNEVSVRRWKNGKIVHEHFYYKGE